MYITILSSILLLTTQFPYLDKFLMSFSHLPRQNYKKIRSRSNPSALRVLTSNICLDGMQNMLEDCGSFLMSWGFFLVFFPSPFRCLRYISLKATKMNFKGCISQTLSQLLHFDLILLGLNKCKKSIGSTRLLL